MKIQPSAANGRMFGNGIYLAPDILKALNYSSLAGSYYSHGNDKVGYLAIFGLAIDPAKAFDPRPNLISRKDRHELNWDKLQRISPGATHTYARKGVMYSDFTLKNSEVIVYNEAQCTIRYLVEIAL